MMEQGPGDKDGDGPLVVDYARLTREDPNVWKRWLQRTRLSHAMLAAGRGSAGGRVLDVGGGDGHFVAEMLQAGQVREAVCFEPAEPLAVLARRRLQGVPGAAAASRWEQVRGRFDTVFCLEVFEHLPRRETRELLAQARGRLAPGGRLVIGVPNEVHGAALLKGLWRRARRPAEFDGRWESILRATWGRPPRRRPLGRLGDGCRYYFHHPGFDHRRLKRMLEREWIVERVFGSPWPWAPLAVASEVYLVARPRSEHLAMPAVRRAA
jgi:SAM-dependent methyltransferase